MTAYTKDEIISASDVVRKLPSLLKEVASQDKARIVIAKNNKLEAIILSIDAYEKLQEAYELMEHMEIYQNIKDRENSQVVSLEDSAKQMGVDLDVL